MGVEKSAELGRDGARTGAGLARTGVRTGAGLGLEPSDERAGVSAEDVELSGRLCEFIRRSATAFQAVEQMSARLDAAGFTRLREADEWELARGGSYYVVRNDSSIVAWHVGERVAAPRFEVVASHCDSPMLKVKTEAELRGPGPYLRLNVEVYGGAIDRSWLDRPLTLAGRALVRAAGERIESRLFAVDRDLLVVPSLAIHMDREVNKAGAIDRKRDLAPLFSAGLLEPGALDELIAREVGVAPDDLLSRDLFVVSRSTPIVWGERSEFVSGPRLDDLQCAFASLEAFAETCAAGEASDGAVSVFACFDNEEVGSGSMQGALSTLLPDMLRRVSEAIEPGDAAYRRAVSRSFMVSCDNAQGVHPNHVELYDETNRAWLNGGVVVKEVATQRYATDAFGRAVFEELCARAGVPVQHFANRSDMISGSTLGNLAARRVSLHTVDVGLAQLAMHSAYETAGVRDTGFLKRALEEFFRAGVEVAADGSVTLG